MPKSSPSPSRDTLARNLRLLRGERGLSQEALADLAGLHRTYVGSIERSARPVSLDTIHRLAVSRDVTVAQLLTEQAA